jgi:hypothetical protein
MVGGATWTVRAIPGMGTQGARRGTQGARRRPLSVRQPSEERAVNAVAREILKVMAVVSAVAVAISVVATSFGWLSAAAAGNARACPSG